MNDTESSVGSVAAVTLNVFPQLESRYKDGYRVAKFVVGLGNSIKNIGAIVGMIIVFGSFITASNGDPDRFIRVMKAGGQAAMLFLGGTVLGGLVWFAFYVFGVMICAQGQLLLATLDSVVNNSPFLDNSQRATMMSLSAKSVSQT